MSQEVHQQGHQLGAAASSADHGAALPAVAMDASSPRGSSTTADASGRKPKKPSHHLQEREQRKVEKRLYCDLKSFLPNVPEKAGKDAIVKETIRYMRYLQGEAAQLERLKLERALAQQAAAADLGAGSSSAPLGGAAQAGWGALPKQQQFAPPRIVLRTFSDANVAVNVYNDDATITVCVPRRPGVLTMVLSVLHKHRIDVVTMEIASDEARTMFSVFTHVSAEVVEQLGGKVSASKDIYQLVMTEIAANLSS